MNIKKKREELKDVQYRGACPFRNDGVWINDAGCNVRGSKSEQCVLDDCPLIENKKIEIILED